MTGLLVTVDGPSGTGKSTVSRAVAHRASLPYLDTGAFYRAATLAALRAGVEPEDARGVERVVRDAGFDQVDGRMYLDGEDVSEEIRGDEVTSAVSAVSSHPNVRRILVEQQRAWVSRHQSGAVVEGRDIGSVVFPTATLKLYLDARPDVRAQRRAVQIGDDPDEVFDDLSRRDHLDSTRAASPLTIPQGAVVVDTSDLSFAQVVDRVLDLIDDLG